MTRPIVLVAALLLAVPGTAVADSVFGTAFFGIPQQVFDGRTEGRAGVGYAYTDSLNAAVTLPTQLVDLSRVTVTIIGLFDTRGAEDQFDTVRRTNLTIPTMKVGLPINRRLAFGFGFQARRAMQWTIVRPNETNPDVEETLEREGTSFEIPFELGLRVTPWLRLGGGAILERGTVRQRYEADIEGGVDPRENREDTHKAITPRVAVAIHDVGPVSVAGFFVPEHDADVDVRIRGVALGNRSDFTRDETRPGRWGVGARVDLSERWNVGFDVENELWSNYSGRGFTNEDGDPLELRDELTLRGGVERLARWTPTGEESPLRVGAFWRRWNYTLLGNDVTEWGVTVGTGIPFRSGNARAAIVAGYGRIGSLSDNGTQENVFRLTFSVTGSEKWY